MAPSADIVSEDHRILMDDKVNGGMHTYGAL